MLRAGTLDVFYLRPQPLLLQLVTSDVSLRRLARAAVGVAALVVGLVVNDVAASPGHGRAAGAGAGQRGGDVLGDVRAGGRGCSSSSSTAPR